jgi:hypothetical protein
MKDHTTNPVVRKTHRDLLLRRLSAIGSRIFRENDGRARNQGWQIIPRYGGLSRTCRDPRFDHLIACAVCNGNGCNAYGGTCSDCQGTGRITLEPAAVFPAGPRTAMKPAPYQYWDNRVSTDLRRLLPVAAPNLLVVVWRWRYEIAPSISE